MKKGIFISLMLALGFTSFAQTNLSSGKEFWFGYMESIAINKLNLYITFSDMEKPLNHEATITVSIPGKVWKNQFKVKNHSSAVMDIPIPYAYINTDDFMGARGVHVESDDELTVRIATIANNSVESATIAPIRSIPKAPSYYVNTFDGTGTINAQLLVIGTESNTKVEITPSADLKSGNKAGIPFTVTLRHGSTYQLKSKDNTSLSGTTVKVIDGCQKIVVMSGNQCAPVSADATCLGCDQLFTQLIPESLWGSEYLLLPFVNTTGGYVYQIAASEDNTSIWIDGIASGSLNKGESMEVDELGSTSHLITSSKPVSVYQYMKSGSCMNEKNGLGDPSLLNVSPFNLYSTSISTKPVHTPSLRTHHLTVVTQTKDTSLLKIDGKSIPYASYTMFGIGNMYAMANHQVDDSIHFIHSDSGFYAISYGYGTDDSYLYALTKNFADSDYSYNFNTDFLCYGDKDRYLTITGDSATNAYWDFGGNNKDTGLSVVFKHNGSNSQKIEVIIINNNLHCPEDTISKTFDLFKAPEVNLGKDTVICIGGKVFFSLTIPNVKYKWSNGSTAGNFFTSEEGYVSVEVTDNNGCKSVDSIYVAVSSCEDSSFVIPNVITPNEDGLNDEFVVKHFGFKKVTGRIINRWGQTVYRFTLPKDAFWNGKVNNSGPDCPSGTYYYILDFEEPNYILPSFKTNGVLTLIRPAGR